MSKRNVIAAYQPPKDCRSGVGGQAVLNDKTRPSSWELERGEYTPYASLRDPGVIDRGGEIDERVMCRCVDCGAPADGPSQSACYRCGSVNEPRCQ